MNINTVQPADIIRKSLKIAQREFEGEMLVITAADSKLHRFNAVGTFIWKVLENPTSFSDICKEVSENFQNFNNNANLKEIEQFLLVLWRKNLIKIESNKNA